MIWRISKCAFSLSKKRHIWHHRLKNRAVSFCPVYHFARSPLIILGVTLKLTFDPVGTTYASSFKNVVTEYRVKLNFVLITCVYIGDTYMNLGGT